MAPSRPTRASLLSDDLLRHLIAVGQVDVLVGLPTLENASTVGPVVLAIHEAIARSFGHARVTVINSDGGSRDGTQDEVRRASSGSAEVLLASHTLRTIHRIVAPFHGLPGRRSALRTILAAADLLQARAVAIVDPSSREPSADAIAALMRLAADEGYDFVGQAPRRHPREGPLLTQFVRPLLSTLFGASFEDPLGQQYACSCGFATHVLAQPIWEPEALRPGIDLALHAEALAGGFRTAQVEGRARQRLPHPDRPGVRETVQQVARALWALLQRHETRWSSAEATAAQPATLALEPAEVSSPVWDVAPLAQVFREEAQQLSGIWRDVLSTEGHQALRQAVARQPPGFHAAGWAHVVADVAVSWRAGRFPADHLAGAFVPLYFGRLAAFLADTDGVAADLAAGHLTRVTEAFAAIRPSLLERWVAVAASGEHR